MIIPARNLKLPAILLLTSIELTRLVRSFADIGSCTKLILTSQTTFQAAVSFVWHAVNGAENLLFLLSDVEPLHKDDFLVGMV